MKMNGGGSGNPINPISSSRTRIDRKRVANELLVASSGKMVLLDKLLPSMRANGHRVIIFSQFNMVLDIIEDFLGFRGFSYERIDGRVRGNERQAAIDRSVSQSVGRGWGHRVLL